MDVAITTSASKPAGRFRNAIFECGGAQIRAHYRRLATVVGIRGEIGAANVDRVGEYVRHFVGLESPLILDLSEVDSFAEAGMALLYTLDEDCRAAGVEWALVGGPAVVELMCEHDGEIASPNARSVHEALRNFADVIAQRRRLLLPLVKKSA